MTPAEGGPGCWHGSRGVRLSPARFRVPSSWAATRCSRHDPVPSPGEMRGREKSSTPPQPHCNVPWVREPRQKGAESRQFPPRIRRPGLSLTSSLPCLQLAQRSLTVKPSTQLRSPGCCSHPPKAGQSSSPVHPASPRKHCPTTGSGGAWLSLRSHTGSVDIQREVSASSSPR